MKKIKKLLVKSICLLLVTITTFSLCGCFSCKPKEVDIGDFRVTFKNIDDEKDPSSWYLVVGLSKAGKKKKTIILPKKINGHNYLIEYRSRHLMPGGTYKSALFEGKMEKFYLEYTRQYTINHKVTLGLAPELRISSQCTNLKKVVLNMATRFSANDNDDRLYYFNYYIYNEHMRIGGWDENTVMELLKVANLQFLYNYNESPNEGYFWIDDIDNGEKVEVKPDTPEREGYKFGGWYTEEECINEFDFNTVFNKPVLEVGETYPEDYVTYLYAKWIPVEG